MSSFRQYGGLNRAATNNIVRNKYSNSDNPTISNYLGQINSKIVSESHIDLSGNSIMNVDNIYFMNGTTVNSDGLPGLNSANVWTGTNQFLNTIFDYSKSPGEKGQVLTSTGSQIKWEDPSGASLGGDNDWTGANTFSALLTANDGITVSSGDLTISSGNLDVSGNTTSQNFTPRNSGGYISGKTNNTINYYSLTNHVFYIDSVELFRITNDSGTPTINIYSNNINYLTQMYFGENADFVISNNSTGSFSSIILQTSYQNFIFADDGITIPTPIILGSSGSGLSGQVLASQGSNLGPIWVDTVADASYGLLNSPNTWTSTNTFNDGLTANADITVSSGDLTVSSGDLTVSNNTTIYGLLNVYGDVSFNGTLQAYGGINVLNVFDAFLSGIYANVPMHITSTLYGNSTNILTIGDTSNNTEITISGTDTNTQLYNSLSNGFVISAQNSSSPLITLQTNISTTSYCNFQFSYTSSSNISNISFAGSNDGTNNILTISSGTGGANVIISGQVQATSFYATSDYRIKENVHQLDNTFIIDNLNPVTYINKLSGKQDIGFIAHEVEEIFPQLVSGIKDGEDNQTLNYQGLIAVLVKEIQELKKRVEILENK